MNTTYLETLPEATNKYKVELEAGEKVVFTAKLRAFGTEQDRTLGGESKFTLTNKRIIADNGKGCWIVRVAEDVASVKKVDNGKKFIFRTVYYAVDLHQEMPSGIPGIHMTGFHFYFDKKGMAGFDAIINEQK